MTGGGSRPEVRAAGAVLWRPAAGGPEVAVVHRPRYDDWSLPKGKLDPGETAPVAAAREVAEETGFRAVLGRYLWRVEYDVADARKTVDYFAARSGGGRFTPNEEVDELRWLPADRADAALTHAGDVAVLRAFRALPAELTTLLLVRHAKAGKREEWTGDDDLRPLSDAGLRQAAALRVLVRPFEPDRVFAAPRLRCVQTVRGVAEDLGVEIRHEPLLGEEGYWKDPVLGVARLLAIVADGGTPVVCSQGGVIPDVVATLAERDGVALPAAKPGTAGKPVASKKGSVWLLSFRQTPEGPRLVDASYFPSPLPSPVPARP
ncbi:8-oxo-dGTP diphosphatase [Amycolatopsis arida]|uniref:8-oxo-dGTP diphosphatase n=1 Tax=Amycolatopsis arida TaxID=587909 RepID=A0A1I5NSU4_9PSEU|nr:NUDIX hydrolase [Amycolatopsis arida]TDX98232.1 8-oxo-dGTP diphosphatase [Amycolatopsis arida]SFP24864.1 8-oxo-dGTP diphosphatase [Amycolatopsis arida]